MLGLMLGLVGGALMTVAAHWSLMLWLRRRAVVAEAKAQKWEELYRQENARSERLLQLNTQLRLALKRWMADEQCSGEDGIFSVN